MTSSFLFLAAASSAFARLDPCASSVPPLLPPPLPVCAHVFAHTNPHAGVCVFGHTFFAFCSGGTLPVLLPLLHQCASRSSRFFDVGRAAVRRRSLISWVGSRRSPIAAAPFSATPASAALSTSSEGAVNQSPVVSVTGCLVRSTVSFSVVVAGSTVSVVSGTAEAASDSEG